MHQWITETKAGDKRSKVLHDHWENLKFTGYSERKSLYERMAGQEKNDDKWLKDKATKDRMLWRANPENYLNTKVEETK